MFNDVTSEVYGTGPLTVVPVKRHVSRIEFDPRDKKVILRRDVPASDPGLQWLKDANGEDQAPTVTTYVEFTCLLLRKGKAPERIVVSIKTTNKFQKAAAELWTTHIAFRPTAIYTGMYTLESRIEKGKNRKGEDTLFGVFVEKNAGFIPTESPAGAALLKMAKAFHEQVKDVNVETAREEDGDPSFDTARMDAEDSRM